MPNVPTPESVTLRDGAIVTIRPVRPDDAPRLQAAFDRLSPESIYLRFLEMRRRPTDIEAAHLAAVDYRAKMAFVATREENGEEQIIAVARYTLLDSPEDDVAEAAIVVEDRYQGRGLGTILADRLVAYARAQGIRAFLAEVSIENARMIEFIRRTGLPADKKREMGVWELRVKLDDESQERPPKS